MKDVVVGIGEVLWDMLPAGREIGGAPANFAYHAGEFGCDSYVVSAVGRDESGREILAALAERGLGVVVEAVDFPTGRVEIEVDCAGVPRYDIKENVAWDNIPFTRRLEELAGRTKAVCFGSLAQRDAVSRSTIRRFLDAMPSGDDVLKVFDINLRQNYYDRAVVEDSMRICNVLKINDDELETVRVMFGLTGVGQEGLCRELSERFGLRMLILTCGVSGSYVFYAGGMSYLSTPKVDVADTVGAGDSFTGSFVARVLAGDSVVEAHAAAVRTSAYVCGCKGAMPSLPVELTGGR